MVLVPMALRSHDASSTLSSVDRFSDAMRVLSRREQTGRGSTRSVVLPLPPATSPPAVPLAVRRLRVLLTLAGLTALTLVLGLFGWGWGYGLFVVFAALTAAYVVHLRRQALRKEERTYRQALRPDGADRGRVAPPAPRAAEIVERMPSRPAPLPVPAARYEDPQPVAATAQSGTWDAVAFPVPTYVNAPVAPPRPTRVVDLTRPGEWTAAAEAEDVGLSILDDGGELDDILEGRRASGDW